jgi:hypothetical protein
VRRAGAALLLLLGCASSPPCTLDPADSGCVPDVRCADAGDGLACETKGVSCQLCIESYHSYRADCVVARDGGLRWELWRGIPPPGCPPQ